ncbi:MAG: hypothetical protein ABFR50_11510 [Candidatus Fermentibacteria bacterium]
MFNYAASAIARSGITSCAALIIISCGGEPAASSSDRETGFPGHELTAYDSIGIEMGDSNYVFGQPGALGFTSEGNIVVGDMSTMKLTMYSPDGVFLRSGGSEGEGAGGERNVPELHSQICRGRPAEYGCFRRLTLQPLSRCGRIRGCSPFSFIDV